ncbi:receptor-type tyrosine-protein phosphatase eta [Aegotheles albertisi]
MRRLLLPPLCLPCLLLPPLLLLLLLPAEVRCTINCTEDCSLKNPTEEKGTSSNDNLAANSTSGNKTYGGGILSGNVSSSDSDQNNVTIIALKAEYVGVTSVNLTWVVNDTAAYSYTYQIKVADGTSVKNLTSSVTEATITKLIPGTLYTFTVFVVVNDKETKGEELSIRLYTKPGPIHGLKAEYVDAEKVNLTWAVNDTAAYSYTYRIEVVDGTSVMNLTSSVTEAEITGLIPGTLYSVTVFAVAADGQTQGEGLPISLYTTFDNMDRPWAAWSPELVDHECRNSDFPSADTEIVRVQLCQLNVCQSMGSDGIHPRVLKELADIMTESFSITYQRSWESGKVSAAWELANVTPVYKKEPGPIHGLKAEYVDAEKVNLTWAVNDTAAYSYTYRIEVVDGTSVMNLTSNVTEAEITELIPGTLYSVMVFAVAADGQTQGEGLPISLYTKPGPIHDLKAEYVGMTSVNLTWMVNDTAAYSYTYQIEVVDGTSVMNLTSNVTEAEITGLIPGTLYSVTVFAVAADGQTQGEGLPISLYTKPGPIHNLKAEYVGMTSVNLTWAVNDTAASYTYRIEVVDGTSVMNLTSSVTEAEITGLIPGTLYSVTVFAVAADGQTQGEGLPISLYTKPGPIHDLKAEYVGMTSVNLTWMVNDTAAYSYMYQIEVVDGTSVMNLTSSVTEAEITGLIPGTLYSVTVFAVAADGQTQGEGLPISLYTIPALVNSFQCEPVAKQSSLMLKWECPSGNNSGFRIRIFNDKLEKEQQAPSCVREGSEETFTTASLDYFSTYTVTIATLSNSSESPSVQKVCNTSITDPPAPSKAPLVKAVSHSSLSVEFSDFESVNGPLKAYAVMITTEERGCGSLKSKLNNTYKDFKKKMTVTYVTYVIDTEQAKSPSFRSQNGTNIVNVGKGNTMYGYENGPLIPRCSYRASVAGFTNITFTMANIIVGEDSYVSFSPCSEAVLLPQDPGVIAGAIIGCLLAILAVVAIGGFIFWRRRRKDKRNTEVSFSPIKSKMIKVENFESYFKKQQADSNCGFAEEYEELKSAGVHQPKFAAELAENRGKNRYNNVLPYDISRVKLSDQSSATDDYINANYIPGYNSKKAFIAAQGPLPNTIEDFWRMIWEKNIYSIVMLTKCVEQARTKCEQYWPDHQSKSYGDTIVTMVSEIVLPEWTIRDFTIEKSDTPESHTVRQFHFTSWPDHGVPETTDLLINFRHLVHEYSSQNPIDSPTLVHCSAGVGRTGTFIAIDRLIQQIEMENTVDVYGVVYDLRMHRPLMVQTEDQYVFLNQCVMDIIRSQKDKKTDLIYQNMTAMAIYENFTPGPGFGKANGYHA